MPRIKEAAARIAKERIEKLATTPMRKELAKKLGPKIEEIAAHPSVKRMYLFGSYASGKPDPSDIDIVVRHKKQLSYTERPPKEITDFHKRYTLKHSGEPGDLHIINTYKPQHLNVPREDKEVVRRETKEFMGGPGHYTIEDLRDAVKAITSERRGMGDLTDIRDIGRDRYGKEHKWIRLLGLGGALGLGATLYNDKAEAGVKDKMIGAPLKSASRAIKGELSSAWKDLAGTEFKGKTIKYVTKGKGDLRYIILNDDTAYPVSKEVVHSLSKAAGTKKSLGEFSAADAEGKLSKAYKSLKYHMSRAYGDENAITDYSKRYAEQIKLSGLEPPKLSLVEADGKKFTMPKDFADLLNNEGAIKKLKDLP
ncbi:MAG: nucleotidyltransferase domain-containing protein [Eubacteriales bacterium]